MSAVLWVPLLTGMLWLVWIRSTGRHLKAVRVVGFATAGFVAVVAAIALVSELARPAGTPPFAVVAGAVAFGALAGLVGTVVWRGQAALVLRWVGLLFVLVAPMVFFGAGLLAIAAAFFYSPALQLVATDC